ncbi:MAG: hypothetical protein V7L26_00770 [Nostoc sp.]|uniref:hypothetical protein n=1 Tax=Nostoc sp. TaxID=1180 RepID=UPI002FF1631A
MANGQNTKTVISLLLELIGVAAPALAQSGVISAQASNIASGISGLILQELQALNQPQPTSPTSVSPAPHNLIGENE